MNCDICGKEANPYTTTYRHLTLCDNCRRMVVGRSEGKIVDFEVNTPEGIVMWILDTDQGEAQKVTNAWMNSGSTYITKDMYEFDPVDLHEILTTMIHLDISFCSRCGEVISKQEIAGRHFAGIYCKDCWSEYKKEHSRRCLLCNQPLYRCTC